jgi:hypothetical protein
MIAMAIPGGQSPNDFNFSVKTQAKSALEILVLAMPDLPVPMGLKGLAKYDRWGAWSQRDLPHFAGPEYFRLPGNR